MDFTFIRTPQILYLCLYLCQLPLQSHHVCDPPFLIIHQSLLLFCCAQQKKSCLKFPKPPNMKSSLCFTLLLIFIGLCASHSHDKHGKTHGKRDLHFSWLPKGNKNINTGFEIKGKRTFEDGSMDFVFYRVRLF